MDHEGYEKMFIAGAEESLALSFLMGPSDMPEVDRMCARHPDTPVIIDHVGGARVRSRSAPSTPWAMARLPSPMWSTCSNL